MIVHLKKEFIPNPFIPSGNKGHAFLNKSVAFSISLFKYVSKTFGYHPAWKG